jgi:hypothetical protein
MIDEAFDQVTAHKTRPSFAMTGVGLVFASIRASSPTGARCNHREIPTDMHGRRGAAAQIRPWQAPLPRIPRRGDRSLRRPPPLPPGERCTALQGAHHHTTVRRTVVEAAMPWRPAAEPCPGPRSEVAVLHRQPSCEGMRKPCCRRRRPGFARPCPLAETEERVREGSGSCRLRFLCRRMGASERSGSFRPPIMVHCRCLLRHSRLVWLYECDIGQR